MANANVTSHIVFNSTTIKAIEKAAIDALPETADAALAETRKKQIMPFDKGSMQNDNTSVIEGKNKASIVSNTPYARRLYFHPEYNFRKTNNSNASGRWFDWLLDGKFLQMVFAEVFKKKGGL